MIRNTEPSSLYDIFVNRQQFVHRNKHTQQTQIDTFQYNNNKNRINEYTLSVNKLYNSVIIETVNVDVCSVFCVIENFLFVSCFRKKNHYVTIDWSEGKERTNERKKNKLIILLFDCMQDNLDWLKVGQSD